MWCIFSFLQILLALFQVENKFDRLVCHLLILVKFCAQLLQLPFPSLISSSFFIFNQFCPFRSFLKLIHYKVQSSQEDENGGHTSQKYPQGDLVLTIEQRSHTKVTFQPATRISTLHIGLAFGTQRSIIHLGTLLHVQAVREANPVATAHLCWVFAIKIGLAHCLVVQKGNFTWELLLTPWCYQNGLLFIVEKVRIFIVNHLYFWTYFLEY